MSDTKFSATPAAGPISDTDAIEGVQGGVTKQFAFTRIWNWILGKRGDATPEAFGAVADTQLARATVNLSAGTSLVWPTPIFVLADVGKKVVLTEAGASSATGSVASIPVSTAGTGYTSVPTCTVTGAGANASAFPTLKILSAGVAAGGTGYLSGGTGTLLLTISDGFGVAAQLTVNVTAGIVTSVASVTTAGAYSVLPSLTVAAVAFPGSGVGATFTLVAGVNSIVMGNVGTAYALSGTTAALVGGGAGTAGTLGAPVVTPCASPLVTTITGYTSGTTVALADAFGTTGTKYRLLAWGTDDSTAFANALASLATGGRLTLAGGKFYGLTSSVALPDDGRTVAISGAGISTGIVALGAMTQQFHKSTILGQVTLATLMLEGMGVAFHNINLAGSHSTRIRECLVRNAAQGGSNLIMGDAAFVGQSYENDVWGTRFENEEGYTTAGDLPLHNIEDYGTDNKIDAVGANAYLSNFLNDNGDTQVTRFHGFGYPVALAPQHIIWNKGQGTFAGVAADTWAPGGSAIHTDVNFGASPSVYVGTDLVIEGYQPVAGTRGFSIASGAKVIIMATSPPEAPTALRAADLIVQTGTPHPQSVVAFNPGAQFTTGLGLIPSTPTLNSLASAFALCVHDGSTTGGNALGFGAADLSVLRSSATQVASGVAAFIAGQSATASGLAAVALGNAVTAAGAFSQARGSSSTDRGMSSKDVWSGGAFAAAGDNQRGAAPLWLKTTATTANQRLTTTGGGIAFSTVGQLANNSAWLMRGRFAGFNPSTGHVVSWTLADIWIVKGATIASTAFESGATPVWTQTSQSLHSVSAPVLSVDTVTYGAPVLTITPPDTTEWHWRFELMTDEVA